MLVATSAVSAADNDGDWLLAVGSASVLIGLLSSLVPTSGGKGSGPGSAWVAALVGLTLVVLGLAAIAVVTRGGADGILSAVFAIGGVVLGVSALITARRAELSAKE